MDFAKARELMVEQQVRPWDVLDARVLKVLSLVPRERFIPAPQRNLAYADAQLPLGNGRFTHKPVYDGRVLQTVLVQPHESVLEIGTGSGYLAACLAGLAKDVVTVESDPALAQVARDVIAAENIANVQVVDGDVFNLSALNGRQFDVVIVSGAMADVPESLIGTINDSGRLFYVRGEAPAMQAVLVTRAGAGFSTKSYFETDVPYLKGTAPVQSFSI